MASKHKAEEEETNPFANEVDGPEDVIKKKAKVKDSTEEAAQGPEDQPPNPLEGREPDDEPEIGEANARVRAARDKIRPDLLRILDNEGRVTGAMIQYINDGHAAILDKVRNRKFTSKLERDEAVKNMNTELRENTMSVRANTIPILERNGVEHHADLWLSPNLYVENISAEVLLEVAGLEEVESIQGLHTWRASFSAGDAKQTSSGDGDDDEGEESGSDTD